VSASSYAPPAALLVIGLLVIALAAVWAGPATIFAFIVFAAFFAGFLVRRGIRRAAAERSRVTNVTDADVPSTEEAAADPVRDSSIPDVARRTPAPR
jgi:uncharacterized membrane protein YjjP (DUF1212 family)